MDFDVILTDVQVDNLDRIVKKIEIIIQSNKTGIDVAFIFLLYKNKTTEIKFASIQEIIEKEIPESLKGIYFNNISVNAQNFALPALYIYNTSMFESYLTRSNNSLQLYNFSERQAAEQFYFRFYKDRDNLENNALSNLEGLNVYFSGLIRKKILVLQTSRSLYIKYYSFPSSFIIFSFMRNCQRIG